MISISDQAKGGEMNVVPPAVQRRITATLFSSQSLFSAALIANFTVIPIMSVNLSGRDAMAGVPSTLSLMGHAAAGYPIGWLMDRFGRRVGLSLGFLVATLGALVGAAAVIQSSFMLLCLGSFLFGIGRGANEQGKYAAAEVYPSDQRAKVIGTIVFAGTVGAIVGPLLVAPAGAFASRHDLPTYTGVFIVSAILTGVALLALIVFLRPDPMIIGRMLAAGETDASAPTASNTPLGVYLANSQVRLAILSMSVGQLVMTTLMVITPVHMHHHAHDDQAVALVLMAHTLGMFGLAPLTGWLVDRVGSHVMIIAGALVLIVSGLLAPLSTAVPLLALALFLLGLGWNFCAVAGSSLLSSVLAPAERGRVQGASETLVALSSGIGSLSTGLLFTLGGMAVVSLAGIGFAVVLLLPALWIGRSRIAIQVRPTRS
jgi:MFS family permease